MLPVITYSLLYYSAVGVAVDESSTARAYTYNHLEQLFPVTDDAGTRHSPVIIRCFNKGVL